MQKSLYLTLILIFIINTAEALTMDEAVNLALKTSSNIREQTYLIESNNQTLKTQRSAFMPRVDLNYTFTRQDNVFFFQPKSSSSASAELTYNLFNSFIDLNKIRAERSNLEALNFKKKSIEEDITLEVKKIFINLLRFSKNLKVEKEAVDLIEKQKTDVTFFFNEGLIAKNDILKVEVELASAKQKKLKAESDLISLKYSLERYIGRELGDEPVKNLSDRGFKKLDRGKLINSMLEVRSELKYLEFIKDYRKNRRNMYRYGFLPSLDLSAKYTRYGDSEFPNGRGAGLFDSDTQATATLSWAIFDGMKRSYGRAKEDAEFMAMFERINETKKELKLQLKIAFENHRVADGNLEVSRKAIEHAKENYRITDNQFKQQMATTTDLLDARVILTRAKNELNNSLYDLHLAIAQIERIVEGDLP